MDRGIGMIYPRFRYSLLDLVNSLILDSIKLKLDIASTYIIYNILDNLLLYINILFNNTSHYLYLE